MVRVSAARVRVIRVRVGVGVRVRPVQETGPTRAVEYYYSSLRRVRDFDAEGGPPPHRLSYREEEGGSACQWW